MARGCRPLRFQFPNADAERTSVGARCRRGRVLRVRILLYIGSIEGLYERNARKSKQEKQGKLYATVEPIPSNFRTPTPRERLSMSTVAIAVSSESVFCSTVDQLKAYMSAKFENQSKSNSTPKSNAYPYNFRTATLKERISRPLLPWPCPPGPCPA